ncbi:MAG TPA: hypothetical protein VFE78_24285 [Gemmataceae bacterium]|jgi:hypothetical protein|nr:hypothetical protein [Gemmataceae bacterium]
MNESKKRFVEQLLAADPPSPDARGRYEKEVRAMLEKTISPRQRRLYLIAAVVSGSLGAYWSLIGLGTLVTAAGRTAPLVEPGPASLLLVLCILATGLALLLVAGMLFRTYWKGAFNQLSYREWAAGAGVTYVGSLGVLFLLLGRYFPELLRDSVQVLGLILLLYAAVAWVRHRIAQAEMRTAEKLLEIELHLAEIGEVTKARPLADTSSPTRMPPT